ncbi:MAG: TSUP family transporter, partial [Pseudomonadota bacterium]
MDQITLYAFATFAIFLAGTIKGAVGLGLPTTSIGLMTIYVDPRTAIALVLIPMFVSNIWQLYRAGDVARAARQYAPFVICLVLFAALTVTMSRGVSERFLLAGLGILFLAFVAVNVTR